MIDILRIDIIRVLLVSALVLCGCQSVQTVENNDDQKIIVEEKAPTVDLTGVWRSDADNPWMFVIAEGGNIPKILRPDGLYMDLSKDSVTTEAPDGSFTAIYTYGLCSWKYDAGENLLSVVVTIDDFYLEVNGSQIHCSIKDEFSGTLSEDKTTWTADLKKTTTFHDKTAPQIEEIKGLVIKRTK